MPDRWEYGGAWERYPCAGGTVVFSNGSIVKAHDIFDELPDFMRRADVIFTDSPWNTGNMRSFYTKAGLILDKDFPRLMERLFACIGEIVPKVCYLEIGKEHLADYIIRMRQLYPHVTFYNSTYYRKAGNKCYVVRGSFKDKRPKLDDMDEEDIIRWVCENEAYQVIGDLCMGRGLVGRYATQAGKRFVGTELNHKRLSCLIETVAKSGISYTLEPDDKHKEE